MIILEHRMKLYEDNTQQVQPQQPQNATTSNDDISKLVAQLDPKIVAILNSGGSNWQVDGNTSKWDDAKNNCPTVSQSSILIELFLRLNICRKNNPSWQQLEPSKDVLMNIFNGCGFKDTENPFIKFIKVFYNKGDNKGYTIPREGWILLNDMYADNVLHPADIIGTGLDRANNLIFNHFMYDTPENISSDTNNIISNYYWLSNENNVNSLNIYNIGCQAGYSSLKPLSNVVGGKGDGHFNKENNLGKDWKYVRNVIIYKDPKKVMGPVNNNETIKKALSTGINNQREGNSTSRSNNNINTNVMGRNTAYNDVLNQISNSNNLSKQEAQSLMQVLQANMNRYQR